MLETIAKPRARGGFFGAALLFHAALIAMLLLPKRRAPVVLEEKPQGPVNVVFRDSPKAQANRGPAPRAVLKTRKPRWLAPPKETPKPQAAPPPEEKLEVAPEPTPIETELAETEGEQMTGVGGIGRAAIGGTGTGGGGPGGAGPLSFNELEMKPPARLSGSDPQYTKQALEHEVEGDMLVRCHVGLEGQVRGCRVVKTVPFMERAVVEALQACRYRPALLADGRPVEVDYTFRIALRLP
ncbi:MAG TPA: TonB family protein [Myxococcales bacterium]|jgi:protein TonB|nr:TonB family protein [Myxococcales bacterium]